MSKKVPEIESIMNAAVHCLSATTTVREALRDLNARDFRHAPIEENGKMIGVVTERELCRVAAGAPEQAELPVKELCDRPPVVVATSTPCDEVCEQLYNKHEDYAIVVSSGKLAGIVTVTDICRAFMEHLREG